MQFSATQKAAAAWGLIALAVVFALWLLAPVLTPFLVAAVLAYALTPLVNRLDRAGRGRVPRLLAVLLVELLLLVALLGVTLLIVPILAKELPQMRDQVPVLFDRLNETLKPLFAQFGLKLSLDVSNIKAFVLKYLNANVEDALGSVLTSLKLGGSVAFTIVGNAVPRAECIVGVVDGQDVGDDQLGIRSEAGRKVGNQGDQMVEFGRGLIDLVIAIDVVRANHQ